MDLFSQGGAFSPPRRPARLRSYADNRYLRMVFEMLAIKIPYLKQSAPIGVIHEELTSLANRTMPPTPYVRVWSMATANMMKSINPKIANSAIILRWNNGAGPGYGCWSIYENMSLTSSIARSRAYEPSQCDLPKANERTWWIVETRTWE